jgi:hypothetical protein
VVTAYISRTVGLSQAADIVEYLKRAGVSVRSAGGGSLMFGSPSHLAMLVELARAEKDSRPR